MASDESISQETPELTISKNDQPENYACSELPDIDQDDIDVASFPLTPADRNMRTFITSLSGGLVEVKIHINKESNSFRTMLQFVHQSVQDFLRTGGLKYLEDIRTSLHGHSIYHGVIDNEEQRDNILGHAHEHVAMSCINYIKREEVMVPNLSYWDEWRMEDRGWTDLDDDNYSPGNLPFIDYAIKSWFVHTNASDILAIGPDLHNLDDVFEGDKILKNWWVLLYSMDRDYK